MKKKRAYSSLYYIATIPRAVWAHPANKGRRVRAIGRAFAWQVYKRLVGRPLEITFNGDLRVICHPDSTYASNLIYFNGLPDFHEYNFLCRYLRPGDGFIDGGANIGGFSLLAASIVGARGQVESFEAHPEIAARLSESVKRNGFSQVCVHAQALSDRTGVVHFTAHRDVSGTMLPESRGSSSISVPTTPLSSAVRSRDYAMCKLDIEGAEGLALRGALPLLRASNPPVWQLEISDKLLPRHGSSRAQLMQLMSSNGFEAATYDGSVNALDFSPSAVAAAINVVFVSGAAKAAVEERLRSAPILQGVRRGVRLEGFPPRMDGLLRSHTDKHGCV